MSDENKPKHPLVIDPKTKLHRLATQDDIKYYEQIEREYHRLISRIEEIINSF